MKKYKFSRTNPFKGQKDCHSKQDAILKKAHKHTLYNADEIKEGKECGCISCERIFPVGEVEEFIDEGKTALCPYCGTDALIADSSGIQLSAIFLSEMNKKYF